MESIAEFTKQFLIPGSLTFLLIGLVLGVILLFLPGRSGRWGRRWLALLTLLYLALSLPFTAALLEGWLSAGTDSMQRSQLPQDIDAIVILGGGSVTYRSGGLEISELSDATSLRVLEGARLYAMLDRPMVIISGGADARSGALEPETDPMSQELMDAGVDEEHLRTESQSGSTREQAIYLAAMLEELQPRRFILVTSPTHMRRALAVFEAQGLHPIPSASAQHSAGHVVLRGGWLPHTDALSASHAALREIMALGYYWVRGWLSSG